MLSEDTAALWGIAAGASALHWDSCSACRHLCDPLAVPRARLLRLRRLRSTSPPLAGAPCPSRRQLCCPRPQMPGAQCAQPCRPSGRPAHRRDRVLRGPSRHLPRRPAALSLPPLPRGCVYAPAVAEPRLLRRLEPALHVIAVAPPTRLSAVGVSQFVHTVILTRKSQQWGQHCGSSCAGGPATPTPACNTLVLRCHTPQATLEVPPRAAAWARILA